MTACEGLKKKRGGGGGGVYVHGCGEIWGNSDAAVKLSNNGKSKCGGENYEGNYLRPISSLSDFKFQQTVSKRWAIERPVTGYTIA